MNITEKKEQTEKMISHEEKKKLECTEPKKIECEKEKLVPHKELLLLQTKHRDLENDLKRLQAEFENFKKRAEKENLQKAEDGKFELAKELVIVVDEFEEAIKHSKETGIRMVYNNLIKILRSNGLKEISNIGKYNPDLHEVVNSVESQKEEGEIIEVLRKGYLFGDRIIRPSMVVISKKRGVEYE
ncbi:MAG: nucleotide exchange factor GrpE [Candidatus Micrarchaeia archaeon]|jgi:molecular chaperone GrpE